MCYKEAHTKNPTLYINNSVSFVEIRREKELCNYAECSIVKEELAVFQHSYIQVITI